MSRIIALTALFALALTAGPPQARDQREYELATQASAATDPAAKLQLLETWTAEYPETALEELRIRLHMLAHQTAGKPAEAIEWAEKLLAIAPEDFGARFTIASLAPASGQTDSKTLERAEQAALALVEGGIAKQFAPANRPPQTSEEQWRQARTQSEAACHSTLGWAALERKDHPAAERSFLAVLERDPSSARTSYQLAQAVLAQRDPQKTDLAFFSLARAASLDGPGALPMESRKQVREYLETLYRNYAGDLQGLDDLMQLAAQTARPPDDMPAIQSKEQRIFTEEQLKRKADPQLYVFIDLRDVLLGAEGDNVWADLKGKITPRMRLWLVSASPPDHPLTLELSSRRDGPVELVVQLETRLRVGIPAGRRVAVEGVARELRREPFRLSLDQGRIIQ